MLELYKKKQRGFMEKGNLIVLLSHCQKHFLLIAKFQRNLIRLRVVAAIIDSYRHLLLCVYRQYEYQFWVNISNSYTNLKNQQQQTNFTFLSSLTLNHSLANSTTDSCSSTDHCLEQSFFQVPSIDSVRRSSHTCPTLT